jgi:hypothetical protein
MAMQYFRMTLLYLNFQCISIKTASYSNSKNGNGDTAEFEFNMPLFPTVSSTKEMYEKSYHVKHTKILFFCRQQALF